MVRLWEVVEVRRPPGARPGERRRISLHWSRESAAAAAAVIPGCGTRMRTLPRILHPALRFVWW